MPFAENARDEARAAAGNDEQGVQDHANTPVGAAQNRQVMHVLKEKGVLTARQCVSRRAGCLWSAPLGDPSTGPQNEAWRIPRPLSRSGNTPESTPDPRLPPTRLCVLVLEGNPISSLMLCGLFVQGVAVVDAEHISIRS